MNVKLSNKVKQGEKENEKLKVERTKAPAIVSKMKAHKVTLCGKLSSSEKEINDRLKKEK